MPQSAPTARHPAVPGTKQPCSWWHKPFTNPHAVKFGACFRQGKELMPLQIGISPSHCQLCRVLGEDGVAAKEAKHMWDTREAAGNRAGGKQGGKRDFSLPESANMDLEPYTPSSALLKRWRDNPWLGDNPLPDVNPLLDDNHRSSKCSPPPTPKLGHLRSHPTLDGATQTLRPSPSWHGAATPTGLAGLGGDEPGGEPGSQGGKAGKSWGCPTQKVGFGDEFRDWDGTEKAAGVSPGRACPPPRRLPAAWLPRPWCQPAARG